MPLFGGQAQLSGFVPDAEDDGAMPAERVLDAVTGIGMRSTVK